MSHPFKVSFFKNKFARTVAEKSLTVDDLADELVQTTAPNKEGQPSFSLGTYGTVALPNGCLRHKANFLMASGGAGDHDAGTMTIDEAAARLDAEGICYIIYSTASHTTQHSRWRVLFIFSREINPNEVARAMNRGNGVLGGVLSRESWASAIGWKYGNIIGQPSCIVVVGDGEEFLDEREDLDAIALPFQSGKSTRPGQTGSGSGSAPDFDKMDFDELLDVIETGEHGYRPSLCYAALAADQGTPERDVVNTLQNAFDAVPPAQRKPKWSQHRANVARWVALAYARHAKRRGKQFAAMVDYLVSSTLYKGSIQYNLFTNAVEVCSPFPPVASQTIGDFIPLRDPQHTLETMISLQGSGFPKATKSSVFDALYLAATRNSVHPVRDYFNSLPVDSTRPDTPVLLKRWFFDHCPVLLPNRDEDPERYARYVLYLEHIGPRIFVAAVARIFRPGCKVDNLVLKVSAQGYNKSKALAALLPEPSWFTDDVPVNVADKDCKLALDGKVIVELSEFPQIRRDVDHLKAFFSRSTDRYRPPYARTVGDWPRQCIFIGTVNELELPDVTGNRRYWPVVLAAPVNDELVVKDRDELWAEALHLFRAGMKWWLPPEIEAIANEIQDSFVESDTRDEAIMQWIDLAFPVKDRHGHDRTRTERGIRFSVREVLLGAFGLLVSNKDNLDGLPVASAVDEKRVIRRLRALKYRPDPHRFRADGRQRFWVPIEA